ncbi:hypothetical protein (mitochondrion) [Myxobolus squamalis]|uniref:Uncharacterized protein n=1 Tax=Myxobolus squamalis TaxID=59785 RepID=A0A678XF36_MYXSQ|nr:hypothetical protein [Myxobolus squamalis]
MIKQLIRVFNYITDILLVGNLIIFGCGFIYGILLIILISFSLSSIYFIINKFIFWIFMIIFFNIIIFIIISKLIDLQLLKLVDKSKILYLSFYILTLNIVFLTVLLLLGISVFKIVKNNIVDILKIIIRIVWTGIKIYILYLIVCWIFCITIGLGKNNQYEFIYQFVNKNMIRFILENYNKESSYLWILALDGFNITHHYLKMGVKLIYFEIARITLVITLFRVLYIIIRLFYLGLNIKDLCNLSFWFLVFYVILLYCLF